MAMQFGVLGPLEVHSRTGPLEIRGTRRRALLAYLLVHAGVPQPLDRIVEALDPEADAGASRATIQTYVSQLRKVFTAEQDHGVGVVHRAGGYLLELAPDALDASRFEAAVASASAERDSAARLAALADALALWRGPPLDEFAGRPWADEPARHWTCMYVLAQQLRAAALLDRDDHRDACTLLEQLVAGYPLHEPFWEQLVIARYRCGEQGDALAAVREARGPGP